jgi:hypothetical protein
MLNFVELLKNGTYLSILKLQKVLCILKIYFLDLILFLGELMTPKKLNQLSELLEFG